MRSTASCLSTTRSRAGCSDGRPLSCRCTNGEHCWQTCLRPIRAAFAAHLPSLLGNHPWISTAWTRRRTISLPRGRAGISRLTQARGRGPQEGDRLKAGGSRARASCTRPHYTRGFPGPTALDARGSRAEYKHEGGSTPRGSPAAASGSLAPAGHARTPAQVPCSCAPVPRTQSRLLDLRNRTSSLY